MQAASSWLRHLLAAAMMCSSLQVTLGVASESGLRERKNTASWQRFKKRLAELAYSTFGRNPAAAPQASGDAVAFDQLSSVPDRTCPDTEGLSSSGEVGGAVVEGNRMGSEAVAEAIDLSLGEDGGAQVDQSGESDLAIQESQLACSNAEEEPEESQNEGQNEELLEPQPASLCHKPGLHLALLPKEAQGLNFIAARRRLLRRQNTLAWTDGVLRSAMHGAAFYRLYRFFTLKPWKPLVKKAPPKQSTSVLSLFRRRRRGSAAEHAAPAPVQELDAFGENLRFLYEKKCEMFPHWQANQPPAFVGKEARFLRTKVLLAFESLTFFAVQVVWFPVRLLLAQPVYWGSWRDQLFMKEALFRMERRAALTCQKYGGWLAAAGSSPGAGKKAKIELKLLTLEEFERGEVFLNGVQQSGADFEKLVPGRDPAVLFWVFTDHPRFCRTGYFSSASLEQLRFKIR